MSHEPSSEQMHRELLQLRDRGGFLAELPEDGVEALADALEPVSFDAGEVLIRPGEASDRLYLVLEGKVSSIEKGSEGEIPIALQLGPGKLVGEIAFAGGGQEQAEIRAAASCRLAALSRDSADRLIDRHPETWRKLSDHLLARMRWTQLGGHLDRLFGPFGKLRPFVLKQLETKIEWLTLRGGDTLFREGDPAAETFILIAGRLRVVGVSEDGQADVINEIGPGETVGEVAFLTGGQRTETVFAARDSELARLSNSTFGLMLERSAKAMRQVSRILVDRLLRLGQGSSFRQAPATQITLIPTAASVPIDEISRTLATQLGKLGSVSVLSSASVDRDLGGANLAQAKESGPEHLRLLNLLQEHEEASRYVIYRADPTWSRWSARCARQADRLVFIADAQEAPELSETESRLAKPNQSSSLVLVHPPDLRRPAGTESWLAKRAVDAVYHVRRGNVADLARLARCLSGRAVSLVLGGGGARAFSQVGVLRALEELGIPVDMVGGSSMGACMGFYVARGIGSTAIQSDLRERWSSLLDYTLPIVSLLAGRKINELIEQDCLGWDLEDLWLPFFCVSTNLTSARSVMHERGNAALAIRATSSVPGLFPPVPDGEDLLVDGGVLNNLPIDLMRKRNPTGPLIAIDVAPPRGPKARSDFGMHVSGWGLLLDRARPWKKATPVPGLAGTILQATIVGAGRARDEMLRAGLADFYHNIHVRGQGMLQFRRVDETVDLGYESTLEPLRKWLESGGIGPI